MWRTEFESNRGLSGASGWFGLGGATATLAGSLPPLQAAHLAGPVFVTGCAVAATAGALLSQSVPRLTARISLKAAVTGLAAGCIVQAFAGDAHPAIYAALFFLMGGLLNAMLRRLYAEAARLVGATRRPGIVSCPLEFCYALCGALVLAVVSLLLGRYSVNQLLAAGGAFLMAAALSGKGPAVAAAAVDHGAREQVRRSIWPRNPLRLLFILEVAGSVIATTWAAIIFSEWSPAPQAQVPVFLPAALYLFSQAAGRAIAPAWLRTQSAELPSLRKLLRWGSGLAAASLLTLALNIDLRLSAAAFALLGLALSNHVPAVMTLVSRFGSARDTSTLPWLGTCTSCAISVLAGEALRAHVISALLFATAASMGMGFLAAGRLPRDAGKEDFPA